MSQCYGCLYLRARVNLMGYRMADPKKLSALPGLCGSCVCSKLEHSITVVTQLYVNMNTRIDFSAVIVVWLSSFWRNEIGFGLNKRWHVKQC